jgi:hypothetical protein
MALPKFEEAVKKAIDERVVANAVVVASSKGNLSHSWKKTKALILIPSLIYIDFKYENTFGKFTLEDSSPPVQLNSVFCVFSCTKVLPVS